MTPYYDEAGVSIYHGDCREVVPLLSFDVMLSDPPYGISLDTSGGRPGGTAHSPVRGDDRPFDPTWLLMLGIPSILWGANHYCDKLPVSAGWLAWIKVIFDGAFGTRMMDKKQSEMELAWTNCVPRPKSYRHLWDGVFRDSESGTRFHPAQKPVALMQWCLSLMPNGVVLDPYAGSGPTLVAAKELGRRVIGIEIEERYCETAAKRLSQGVLPLEFSA